MNATPQANVRLEALLDAVLSLREGLRKLDELGLHEAAAHVDQALEMVEPFHPDVVAGLHGPRPIPDSLRPWFAALASDPD